ncbi:hypothetical protein [Coprobacillus sp. AF33-1AC]|uniref:hypothetical protein n=1 Tax=Coprobacillus sp. AF33-1AC TaxID=2292032 RepID=UPI000E4DA0FD|nr:hypothetical protein [Coprobacillus sp. AF33-1AC]RHM59637.1 hypothetical protein DWZ53_08820 [Coprobacillus sp. AF33-1AC]
MMKSNRLLFIAIISFLLFLSCCINLNYQNELKNKDNEIIQLKKELIEKEDTIDRINEQVGVYDK